MDQNDTVRSLITTISSFIQDRLTNKEQRNLQKEQCAERLAAEDGSLENGTEVRYSDQAVLANLDWGMEALEEAINTSNMETKMARLDYAEKMLQVCAMLDSSQRTAGVPNFYLSAWAHLNLSYLWKLRNNSHNAVLHVLEMFIVDPFFSRIDFSPELWKTLFLSHMSSIVGWYSEERHKIVMDAIPDSNDLSLTVDFDQHFNESLIFSMRPDQAEKMQDLEQLYGRSLDENTRLYAKYYKDCMNYDSTTSKKVIQMIPIAEPPMTPLHEVSGSIPDFVKFGPILPKSAGFSPVLKSKENTNSARSQSNSSSTSPKHQQKSTVWTPQEGIPEENEDNSDIEPRVYEEVTDRVQRTGFRSSTGTNYNMESGSSVQQREAKSRTHSPSAISPSDPPKSHTSNNLSPRKNLHRKKENISLLRLLSSRAMDSPLSTSLPGSPLQYSDSSTSSVDSDCEMAALGRSARKNNCHTQTVCYEHENNQEIERSFPCKADEKSQSFISLPSSEKLTQSRAPKDFVCPITSQTFYDPVTLETGQTYERKAIEEWMKRGNKTCPITRQPLSATVLPSTNYVLKRLITSWKEQHPDLALELSYSEPPSSMGTPLSKESVSDLTPSCMLDSPNYKDNNLNLRIWDRCLNNMTRDEHISHKPRRFVRAALSTSPTSVISQAAVEAIINGLKPHISCICTSEDLQECEAAVLKIASIWKDSKANSGIHSYLSTPMIINGLVEILSASLNREALRASIYILSELTFANDSVGKILTSVDSDFDCLAALLKKGLAEAVVLIYLLKPAFSQLSAHNFVTSLIQLISSNNESLSDLELVLDPKDAAIALLEQILMGADEKNRFSIAMSIISANGIPCLLNCLDRVEGRHSIIYILLCCIHSDKSCNKIIASRIEFSPVLELLHTGSDCMRGICIDFLSVLIQLDRRTLCNKILQTIKDEGAFCTMHTLLAYLQMAPMEQQIPIATLLLQLDLLVDPRKMSIYREEAVEALTEALCRKDFPNSQIMALDALLSLSGHLTALGKPCTEAWLLKVAGFDQPYVTLKKAEKLRSLGTGSTRTMEEDKKASHSWKKRVAFVLCNHEKGSIFRAFEECLNSNSIEIAKSSLVVATWMVYMLYMLPDTGIREVARESLLKQFINILQSSKNLEEKFLATLALRAFITDPGALNELALSGKCVFKTLKKLKRNSVVVNDVFTALMNLPSVDAAEMWSCSEGVELDSCMNGEVLALVRVNAWVVSSHSDGTMKVWDASKKVPLLIQEVREHTKAVTCLHVASSKDKLYTGSLDKTIRVWAIKQDEIICIQVHDVKEAVYELATNANVACFVSQGTGVKVYNWSGAPRHINFNKYVKCFAMTGNKLYCGCTGYSIQEVDLGKLTSTTFYSGTRKLLGKQTIHSLYIIHDNQLIAAGSSVDGTAGKVFSLSNKAVIGSLSTSFDIHRIAVNNDLIFTATKCGIEVWMKEKVSRISSIKMPHAKITSLTTDLNGEMLFAGSSDGKIQIWNLD